MHNMEVFHPVMRDLLTNHTRFKNFTQAINCSYSINLLFPISIKCAISVFYCLDILWGGTNPYFRYGFVPATTVAAVGKTRQPM
jgi:hypothetical protein